MALKHDLIDKTGFAQCYVIFTEKIMTLGPSVHIFSCQNTSQFSEESATKNAEQLQCFQKGTFRAPCGRVRLAERTFAKPQICRRGFYFPSIHILSHIELNRFKVSKQEVLRPKLIWPETFLKY